jgi:hypothetical protein
MQDEDGTRIPLIPVVEAEVALQRMVVVEFAAVLRVRSLQRHTMVEYLMSVGIACLVCVAPMIVCVCEVWRMNEGDGFLALCPVCESVRELGRN